MRWTVQIRKARMNTVALSTTETNTTRIVLHCARSAPNAPALPPSADRTVVANTAIPPTVISTRLRSRSLIGLGRRCRGTAQATFIAFCNAWATPNAPYSATSPPTTRATPLPCKPCGSPSSSPMTGNWLNVESRIRSCRSGSLFEHESENRSQQEEQREQRQEPVVRDQRGEVWALVLGELVHNGEREARPPVALLKRVEPLRHAHVRRSRR